MQAIDLSAHFYGRGLVGLTVGLETFCIQTFLPKNIAAPTWRRCGLPT
jgi:hypothetical protein